MYIQVFPCIQCETEPGLVAVLKASMTGAYAWFYLCVGCAWTGFPDPLVIPTPELTGGN